MPSLDPTRPGGGTERHSPGLARRHVPRASGADVVGLLLQLAQIIPAIATALHPFVTGSWALRLLTVLVAVAASAAAFVISARRRRRRCGGAAGSGPVLTEYDSVVPSRRLET